MGRACGRDPWLQIPGLNTPHGFRGAVPGMSIDPIEWHDGAPLTQGAEVSPVLL